MTGALKPYPAYRDSGLPWLGRVPKHWEVRRLKDHGTLISGTGFPHSHQGRDGEALPFYKVGDLASCDDNIHVDAAPNSISYETATHLRATVVPKGAIIYAKIGEALLLNRRRITKTSCCIDNNMTAFVPNNNNLTTKWAFYWTCILDFGSTYNPGAVPFIGERNQAMLPMLIPPLDEQFAIARYLDHVSARVDRYIGAKERLIALLKERKQAIIDRAVTRGLDPNAPMKPTGMAWIPEVPAHWEVRRLKQICRMEYGDSLASEARQEGTVPVFGSNGCVDFHNVANTKAPCIVVGRKGSFGKINYSDVSVFAIDTTFFIDSRFSFSDIRWLYFLLKWLQLDDVTKDSAIPGLDREDAYQRLAPLPPVSEQAAIVEHLERSTAVIDTAIDRARHQIGLLREYRERLINDVVTGKLDVRGVHVDGHDPSEETAAGHRRGSLTGAFSGSDAPGA